MPDRRHDAASGSLVGGKTDMHRCHALVACALPFALALCLVGPTLAAEEPEEPRFEDFVEKFRKPYFRVGVLLQAVFEYQSDRTIPGEDGFSIPNSRLILQGEFDSGWGYLFATNFSNSPALLDGKLYYRITDNLAVDAGLMKAPFSAEYLIFGGDIDFVNRSQVVNALAPQRQIGTQLRGTAGAGAWNWAVGVFNGNRPQENVNDNPKFLWAGRLAWTPHSFRDEETGSMLEVAISLASSRDDNVDLLSGRLPGFMGDRELLGWDLRFTRKRWLVSAETILARLDPVAGDRIEPDGFHVTAGYRPTRRSQVLLRLDKLSPDAAGPDSEWVIAGYNFWPTKVTEFQANYVVPTDGGGLDSHQVLLNVQVSF